MSERPKKPIPTSQLIIGGIEEGGHIYVYVDDDGKFDMSKKIFIKDGEPIPDGYILIDSSDRD